MILTTSKPVTQMIVTFEAEKSSVPPVLPDPNSTDTNLVLVGEDLSPMAVGLSPDGETPVHRVGGTYTYVMKNAKQAGSALQLAVHPWTDFLYSMTDATLPQSTFTHGIFDADLVSLAPV